MTAPGVGDIWTISQTAWRIKRAFAAGRKDAPPDFQLIEAEVGGLARALKLLSEALHADDGMNALPIAGASIRDGIGTIIASCQRTINDLDSLMSQYQIIKKHRTSGGFAIEVTWSDLVLDEYRTMIWTSEGGDLHDLTHLLQLHISAVTLTMQAVQSGSLHHLESIILPLADRIYDMHHSSQTVNVQVKEVQELIHNLAILDPTVHIPPIPERNPARFPVAEKANLPGSHSHPSHASGPSVPCDPNGGSAPQSPRCSHSPGSPIPLARQATTAAPISPSGAISPSRASVPARNRMSEISCGASPLRYSSSSCTTSDAGTSFAGWPSPGSPQRGPHNPEASTAKKVVSFPPALQEAGPDSRFDDKPLPLLPAPDLTPSTPFEPGENTRRFSYNAEFEKEAFRNSAILCDVRGRLVEYSHQLGEEDGRGIEMVTASEACRIAVVRKRMPIAETQQVRVVTSIWTLSDNGSVRMELRMADDQMYIPYSSYFSLSKVSITVPCKLKFHDVQFGNKPLQTVRTTWVNYLFDSAEASALFQNELMGRTLLATLRTERTMRIHEGISGHFAYAEQLCALENLRIWKDSQTGAIIALIHFSASFRNGYLAFYLNSLINPIKVKDDGGREVKIKGLRVPIDRKDHGVGKESTAASHTAGSERDKGQEKTEDHKKKMEKGRIISGAKIEFRTEMEKKEFLDMCHEMQRNMIELPDLLGVN